MTFTNNLCRAAYTHARPGFHAASPPSPGLVFTSPAIRAPAQLTGPAAQLPSRCLVPQFHTKSMNDTGYNP